ncbi:hypothetical protein DLAC_06181 [Tieghemostelium lacteum]|uniref:Uncharacterized protein n=1 Tax=Tieghemostelium lacteum TaxID=361077 RepID=A0A151ZHU8_TIELA|nr:hypothetical protein DLAC_06181 [Tieghemostelium lacteum]|eukprot:KYQ93487.1 hypothetical protein DLAC_06181 [Tieghemostelium lacteum]
MACKLVKKTKQPEQRNLCYKIFYKLYRKLPEEFIEVVINYNFDNSTINKELLSYGFEVKFKSTNTQMDEAMYMLDLVVSNQNYYDFFKTTLIDGFKPVNGLYFKIFSEQLYLMLFGSKNYYLHDLQQAAATCLSVSKDIEFTLKLAYQCPNIFKFDIMTKISSQTFGVFLRQLSEYEYHHLSDHQELLKNQDYLTFCGKPTSMLMAQAQKKESTDMLKKYFRDLPMESTHSTLPILVLFTEVLKHHKLIFSDPNGQYIIAVTKLKLLTEKQSLWTQQYDDYFNAFEGFVLDLKNSLKDQAKNYVNSKGHKDTYLNIYKILKGFGVDDLEPYENLEKYQLKSTNFSTMSKFLADNFNFSIGLTVEQQMPLIDRIMVQEKRIMSAQGKKGEYFTSPDKFLDIIIHYKDSNYFLVVLKYFRDIQVKNKGNSNNNSCIEMDSIIEHSIKFLKLLVDIDPTIPLYEQIFREFSKIPDTLYHLEFPLIFKFFYPEKDFTKAIADNITSFINKATLIFGLKENIVCLVEFIDRSEYLHIKDFKQSIDNITQITSAKGIQTTFKEAEKTLNEINDCIGSLNHHQLKNIQYITPELMEFFSSFHSLQSFDDNIQIISSNLIGDKKNSSLLDKSVYLKNLLHEIIQYKMDYKKNQVPKELSFKDFCLKITKMLPTNIDVSLKFVNNDLNLIKSLLNTGGTQSSQTSLQTAMAILEESLFQSNTTKSKSGVEGWSIEITKSGLVLSHDKIEDIVRGLTIINTQDSNNNNLRVISDFKNVFNILQSIHEIHNELSRVNHFEYMGGTIKLDIDGNNIQDLIDREKDYQTNIQEWTSIIQSLPRQLLLLRTPGISSLFSQLTNIINKNTLDRVEETSRVLLPFTRFCIPIDSFSIDDIIIVVQQYPALFEGDSQHFLNQFVPLFLEHLKIEDSSTPPIRSANEEIFTFVTSESQASLFNNLMILNNGVIPHPKQLFYSHSFRRDIDIFFNVVSRFPEETFFVIGIPNEKEKLLSWISKHFSDNTYLAKVYFISTDENSINNELFSFLPKYHAQSNDNWSNFKEQWNSKVKTLKHLSSLNLVKGISGSGKTHFIKSQSQGQNIITVLVRHEFDLNVLVEKIRSLQNKQKSFFIHFIISPLCSYDVLNHFFYPLIGFGFIFGSSGQFININESKSTIYVEIGSPLDSKKIQETNNYNNNLYNDYVYNSIPIISKLSTHMDHTKFPWQIGTKEMTCFSFAVNNLTTYPPISGGQHITMDQYLQHISDIIEGKFNSLGQTTRFLSEDGFCIPRKNFFSLIYERLQFLQHYHLFYQSYLDMSQDQNNEQRYYLIDTVNTMLTCQELYHVFLLESIQLSDPNYSSADKIWKNPPLVTARSILTTIIDNIKDTKAIVDFIDFSNGNGNILPYHKRNSLFTLQHAQKHPNEFKTVISNSFGITTRTYIINYLSEQYGFVLTNELAHRLVVLNNKIKTQRSLILTGDTGVGKTFILIFYSLLINASNDSLPDIIHDIKEHVNKLLKDPHFSDFNLKPISIDGQLFRSLPGCCKIEHIIEVLNQMSQHRHRLTIPVFKTASIINNNNQIINTNDILFSSIGKLLTSILTKYQLIYLPRDSILKPIKDGGAITSIENLVECVQEICSVKFQNLFHRIIMHKKFSSKEFKNFVNDIVHKSTELSKIDRNMKMVVFIDEFNTSPNDTLALINEIFIDGTLDGEGPLPDNIFWIGAMNPLISVKDTINYTGRASENTLAFVVQEIPPSMKNLFFDYGTFQSDSEKQFLDTLFETQNVITVKLPENELKEFKSNLKDSILIGQSTLRKANQSKTHVSIRDIMRALDIYKFFNSDVGIKILRCHFNNLNENDIKIIHWLSIICSFYMTYVLRLSIENDFRDEMISAFESYIHEKHIENLMDEMTSMLTFQSIYSSMCDEKWTNFPEGIARTDSLKLNIFFTIVSIGCGIPLLIVGPPGCSKTLSFSIVLDNINSHKEETQSFYSLMPNAIAYRYQCSAHTTDIEIKDTMDRAIERQKVVGSSKENKIKCVIHFDEAGLVDEENQSPMKVMHDYLDKLSQKTKQTQDHEDVAIIILSNKMLDAAKANRMLILLHPPTISDEDEIALVVGCLFGYKKKLTQEEHFICDALSKSYKKVNQFSNGTKENLFHQRDFVFFLRHLKRSYKDSITSEGLLNSLERHFNGIPLYDLQLLVAEFFRNLKIPLPTKQDNTILRIKESLKETLSEGQNPNTSAFRYMMLIDPSENESSLLILKELENELDINYKVIRVGGFEKDNTPESLVSVVSQIKNEMELGGTVVLVNIQSIESCFYDVFNRYFQIVYDTDGNKSFVANVSFGTHSANCFVHPNFKIIVHLPLSQLKTTQLPWLNRFEKYYLSVDQLLNQLISTNSILREKKPFFDKLQQSGKHFVQEFHHKITNNSLLFGYSNETISSMVYTIAKQSLIDENTTIVPQRIHSELTEETLETNEFRLFNWKLLQIARPESIFKCKSLSESYIKEYIMNQEHFNCFRFLRSVFENYDSKLQQSNKWVLYTRTSLTFHRLKDNEYISVFYDILSENISDSITKDTLKILQLHSIDSTSKCNEQLNSFKQSKTEQILLVFADLTLVNQNQINYLLESFDSKSNNNKMLIIICHFPPEYSIYNQSKIHSIFLNKTEYLYIDSFGINIDLQVTEKQSTLKHSSDIRNFIAQAFGIIVENDSSLHETLTEMFYEHLNYICLEMAYIPGPIIRGVPPLSGNEDTFYRIKSKRLPLLNEIFKNHPIWVNQIIDKFVNNWNSNEILKEIINNVSTLIHNGKLSRSFIDSIKDSLISYFYPVISQFIKLLFNHRTYNTIESIKPGSVEQKLVSELIFSIKSPKISKDISQRYEPITLYPPIYQYSPSQFPLYDTIFSIYENLFSIVLNKVQRKTSMDLQEQFDKLIQSHPIQNLNDIIVNNPQLNSSFLEDFICRTMKIEIPLLHPFILLHQKLSVFRSNSISQYFVNHYSFNNLFIFIRATLFPITCLTNLDINTFTSDMESIIESIEPNQPKKIKKELISYSFNILYNYIIRILDGEDEIDHDEIINWTTAVGEMLNRSPLEKCLLDAQNLLVLATVVSTLYQIFISILSKPDGEDNLTLVVESLKSINYLDTLGDQSILKILETLVHLKEEIIHCNPELSFSTECILGIVQPLAYIKSDKTIEDILQLCHGITDFPLQNIPNGWFVDILKYYFQSTEGTNIVLEKSDRIFKENNIHSMISPMSSFENSTTRLANCLYYLYVDMYQNSEIKLTVIDALSLISSLKNDENRMTLKIQSLSLEVYLIKHFCDTLSSSNVSSINNKEYVQFLNYCFITNSTANTQERELQNKNNQLLFLNSISDQQVLFNYLQSKQFLDKFSLGNLYLDNKINASNQFSLPFVYLESDPHHSFYLTIKNSFETGDFTAVLNESTNYPILRGLFRTVMFILLYREYSEKPNISPIFVTIWQNQQLINHFDLGCVKRIYDKLLNQQFSETEIDKILQKRANKSPYDVEICSIIVNFVAIALGSNERSYLYHFVRSPQLVASTIFPAHDGYTLIDCGIKTPERITTAIGTTVMGGNVLKKFVVTSSIWSLLAFSTTVYTEHYNTILTIGHAIQQPGVIINLKYLVNYLFERGQFSIIYVKNNAEQQNNHIEVCPFLTEFIYLYWRDAYQSSTQAHRSIFASVAECQLLEYQVLIPIINKVQQEYSQKQKQLIEMVEKQSAQHASYLKIRQQMSNINNSASIAFDSIKNFITNQNEPQLKILSFMINNIEMICLSTQFPTLINFLKLFFQHFRDRLTIDHVGLTFPDALDFLTTNSYETKETSSNLKLYWGMLKSTWLKVTNIIKETQFDCHNDKVPLINDETPMAGYLPLIEGKNGAIIDVIDTWMLKTQSECLNFVNDPENTISDSIKSITNGFKSKHREHDISDIPLEYGDNFMLMGSDFNVDSFKRHLEKLFSLYQSMEKSKFKPDLHSIQNQLIVSYLSGKVMGSQLKSFRGVFPFKKQIKLKATKVEKNIKVPQSIKDIQSILSRFNDTTEIDLKSIDSTNQIQKLLGLCNNHDTLDLIARYLSRSCITIINQQKEIYENQLSQDIYEFTGESSLPSDIISILRNIPLGSLISVCNRVIDEFLSYGYLYSNLIPELPQHVGKENKNFFHNLKFNLIELVSQCNDPQLLKSYIEFLKTILTKLTSNHVVQSIRSNINVLFYQKAIHVGEIESPFIIPFESFYDRKMSISVYPLFLRTIHEILSYVLEKFETVENFTKYQEPFNNLTTIDQSDIVHEVTMEEASVNQISQPDSEVIYSEYAVTHDFMEELDSDDEQEDGEELSNDDVNMYQTYGTNSHTEHLRPIKLLEKQDPNFSHCIFNWLRYIPEFDNILTSKKSGTLEELQLQLSKFRNRSKKNNMRKKIDIEKLCNQLIIDSEVKPTNTENISDKIISILETISNIDPTVLSLFQWTIKSHCDTCNTDIENQLTIPLKEFDPNKHSSKSLQEIFNHHFSIQNSCLHNNITNQVINLPKYIFIPINRFSSKNYSKIQLDNAISIDKILPGTKSYSYSIDSIISLEESNLFTIHIRKSDFIIRCSNRNTISTLPYRKTSFSIEKTNCVLVIMKLENNIIEQEYGSVSVYNNFIENTQQNNNNVLVNDLLQKLENLQINSKDSIQHVLKPEIQINNNNSSEDFVYGLDGTEVSKSIIGSDIQKSKESLDSIYEKGPKAWISSLKMQSQTKSELITILESKNILDFISLFNFKEWENIITKSGMRNSFLKYVDTLKKNFLEKNIISEDDLNGISKQQLQDIYEAGFISYIKSHENIEEKMKGIISEILDSEGLDDFLLLFACDSFDALLPSDEIKTKLVPLITNLKQLFLKHNILSLEDLN